MRGLVTDVSHSTNSFCCSDQHVQDRTWHKPWDGGNGLFSWRLILQMPCRAATLTSYGDEKRSFQLSQGEKQRLREMGSVKSGSSRKKKWKHARLQGAQRREGGVSASVAEGPVQVADFSEPRRSGPLKWGRRPKHIYTY